MHTSYRSVTKRALLTALGIIVLFGISQCSKPQGPIGTPAKGDPEIFTTFYPTRYFAETIAGGAVKVTCPCPADADPIFWKPDRDTLAAYQKADLVILNGASFEKWVAKVSLPQSRVVDSAKGLSLLNFEHATTHSHGPAGEHSHEGIDGHTWVDPVNALHQATHIHAAMVKHFPEHKATFDSGFAKLKDQLSKLDSGLQDISKTMAQTPILCSHPAYNYVGKRYNWNLRNLDLDPETELTEKQLQQIRTLRKDHPAKILLWEGTPSKAVASQTEDLGLRNVLFSPCEGTPDAQEGDYIAVMNRNLETLRSALSGNGK